MAELRFFFGTMGSGKSTQALQIRHNLAERGLRCLLISQLDRQTGRVSSRLGISAAAVVVDPTVDLYRLLREEDLRPMAGLGRGSGEGLHAVICDEAQFSTAQQVDTGGTGEKVTVTHDLRCRRHWNAEKQSMTQAPLFEGDW